MKKILLLITFIFLIKIITEIILGIQLGLGIESTNESVGINLIITYMLLEKLGYINK